MEFFRKGLEENITLPAPPTDDVAEAKEVKRIVAIRTAKDVESVMNHDRVPFYAIRTYCDENGLIFHKGEFEDVIQQATPIIKYFKEKFNRKRPIEIDKTLNNHYRILFANLEYHLLGNHLLENAFSLLFGAYYFKNEKLYNKSKKILTPVSEINFIPSGPLEQKYSSPNLNAPTSGIILVNLKYSSSSSAFNSTS